MKNKVLHVRSTIGMYGAEKVLLNLATAPEQSECDFGFYLIEGCGSESGMLRKKIDPYTNNLSSIVSKSKFDWKVIKQIRELSHRYAIVHTHDYKSLVLASIALIFKNTKIVHHIHGALGNTFFEKIYSKIEYLFMLGAKKIITVSHEQKSDLSKFKLLRNKIIQVNNGTKIHDAVTPHKMNDVLNVLMVARFTPEKDHGKAIDVIHFLVKKGLKVKLDLLGDGPCSEDIKKKVRQLNLGDAVNFIGFTNDVEHWLNRSQLTMLTSVTEGLPMTVLESMASGVPVISTPVGEVPSLIEHSSGGWLAEEPEEFASTIEGLILNPEKLYISGYKAFEYAKSQLSIENQLNQLLCIYEGLSGDYYERCSL